MASGFPTTDLAKEFGLSPDQISKIQEQFRPEKDFIIPQTEAER